MLPSVKLKLRLILLSFMEVMDMLDLDMPVMLDTLMLLESMVMDSQLPLLVMPPSAPLLAPALLDLLPLLSLLSLEDMLVPDVM